LVSCKRLDGINTARLQPEGRLRVNLGRSAWP